MGIYVGETVNLALLRRIKGTLNSFLTNMLNQGLLGSIDGSLPFSVVCDATNNPPYLADTGMLTAEIGVAPAEPIEFIVIRLSRGADGTLSIQD